MLIFEGGGAGACHSPSCCAAHFRGWWLAFTATTTFHQLRRRAASAHARLRGGSGAGACHLPSCWQLQLQLLSSSSVLAAATAAVVVVVVPPHIHVETWFCQQKKRKNNHGCTFAPAVLVVPFCVRVVVHGGIGRVEWEGVRGGGCRETQR